ncbi:Pkinase domain-containing protein/Ank_2 domain-containing protein/Ank_3 domain-containing protein/zf-RING_2 domain-containing protein [Cephalotus follicularis]|uniref:RING-type E3 ubiquitin transferase n=1 Tax=Cephalotus follicularis TaxID=3775 RepID=A0A1Q3B2E1_CEPFO|nr:Pkinase domain-containing protein/Ank_2 domain-containing protein/Ank_3 domain-containing protein/zf-RING_2 domain-containing protein [Cephalotus follicularis]
MGQRHKNKNKKKTMRIPKCPICQTPFSDQPNTTPLLLNCGHTFCHHCLSTILSSAPHSNSKPSLSCPKCRHLSPLGNSLLSLPKNFSLLLSLSDLPLSQSDSDSDSEQDDDSDAPSCLRGGIGLADHTLRGGDNGIGMLVKGRCRHRVVLRRVERGDDWVERELENLRRRSTWCSHVCAFYGVVKTEDHLLLVMEQSFGSVESEMRRSGGRLTLDQILRYGADIARGVAELHAAGVVCLNLKPSNFVLDESGHAMVSDYGLPMILKKPSCRKARPTAEVDSKQIHWCIDCMLLSPHYTAPEVWEPLKKSLHLFRDGTVGISAESDSWSFGCALVEMCTGSVPWAGLTAEEIYRAIVKDGRLPPQYATVVGVGIPAELWKMIGECLQYKASKRPTFHAMLAVFLRQLQGIPHSPAHQYNEHPNCPGLDILEQSPTSVLDIFQVKSNHLHQLVSEGNFDGVRDLLAKSASGSKNNSIVPLLEAHNADGQTALHLACRRGCPELVNAILEYGDVDVDIPDGDGNPPIVFALAAGSPDCVRALIRRSENGISRLRENFGRSVGHICAYYGQPECMQELIQGGADPNAVDDDGESVLHVAIAKKFTECAIVILENGGSRSMNVINSKNLTPLHLCIETLNVAVVKKWLEVASSKEIAEAINVSSPAGTALCMAAALKKGHETEGRELVRTLLAAGANPAAQDTEHHRTALHTAAMANDVELVKIFLDAGVDVNLRNVHNTIPLHLALAKGAKPCVEVLLAAGADCGLQDDDGDNAFHIAAHAAKLIRENLECVILMLQHPTATVEVRNNSGKTLRDFLEALPREWISEDLLEALTNKGIYLSPIPFEVGDWVKFRRSLKNPAYGWQGARHGSVGFVRSILDRESLVVTFCTGVAHVLVTEVTKVIPLDRGQLVQLKPNIKEPRYQLRGQSRDSIGTVLCVEDEGIIRIGFTGASRGWQADPADFQRVEEFKVGDWVRVRHALPAAKHGFGAVTPGSIGTVYGIRPDCSLLVEFSYLSSPWLCEPEEIEPVVPFRIGELVCVKRSVAEPRCEWGGETHHSVGRISDIESSGLLIIEIANRPIAWKADPSDIEKIEEFEVGDWVRVKASVPSPKYGWEDVTRTSIGVVHSLEADGDMSVAFCFRSRPFSCSMADLEKVSPFEVGQEIRLMPSVNQPQLGWSNETHATFGNISRIDMDGTLNVRVAGRVSLWKVAPGDAERLPGLVVGDWVRLKQYLGTRASYEWNSIGKDCLAIVHSVHDLFHLELVCCFQKGKIVAHFTEVEKVERVKIGQHVRFRAGLVEPRWGWRGASSNSRGVVIAVNADGELRVSFFGLLGLWRGDPTDFEIEQMFEVGEWVKLRHDANSWKSLQPGSIGVVHGIGCREDGWDGTILVTFCGEQEQWVGPISELEKVDKLVVGQRVQVKRHVKHPRFGWSGHTYDSISSISAVDADGKLHMCTIAGSKAWMLDPSEVNLVEKEVLQIGDWVKVKSSIVTPVHHWGEVTHGSIGVVHQMEEGELLVAFCFLDRLWVCKESEMTKVRAFKVGDKVRFREGLVKPRWGWGMETPTSKGQVVGVDANGKLRIKFKWREGRPWIGDPADIVLDEIPNGVL